METLIAIAHIAGALISVLVFGFLVLLIAGWEADKNQKRAAEEASVSLGVSIDDLNNEELGPRILQYSSEKFSSELFRNRLSDFCGLIRTVWGWLSTLAQVCVLAAVVWYTFSDNTNNAIYAWFILAISVIFSLVSVIFSLICKLLTGRYPDEAKQARKAAIEWVNNQNKSHQSEYV